MIKLKVIKSQGFTLSLEDTFFEKPQGGGKGGGCQIEPPSSLLSVNLKCNLTKLTYFVLKQAKLCSTTKNSAMKMKIIWFNLQLIIE